MDSKQKIQLQLQNIVDGIGGEKVMVSVERPKDLSRSDFTSTIAMTLAKVLKRSPMEIAEDLVKQLAPILPAGVKSVEAISPGYINFYLTQSYVISCVQHLLTSKYAGEMPEKPKKVIVEYSSPNIAKPFTIGHLRSTIIGDAVANILEAVGYEVYRDNHIGDWGTQFGKQIYAIKTWGDEEEIKHSDRPVKLLVDLYVKFHEEAEKDPSLEDAARAWFKKLEDGDEEARDLWGKCIDWSWKEFEAIYKELGVPSSGKPFENNGRGYGEAYFEDKMEGPIAQLEKKGLLKEGKEGAKIVEFPDETKMPPLMILKKDGASLYATRDLATDSFRITKYGSDIVILNEVGAEQALYWQQLYALEQMLGWFAKDQRIHIKHGMYRFKEGKMSTRKGNVIWLEDVLEEAKKRARDIGIKNHPKSTSHFVEAQESRIKDEEELDVRLDSKKEEVAQIIGIGAIKWNDLKRDAKQDINFDWNDVLSMQGNSGPYMQYVAVRCSSVLDKAKIATNDIEKWDFDTDIVLQKEEELLLRMLSVYPEILKQAATDYAPHVLCTYLFDLAQTFNNFYQKLSILNPDSGQAPQEYFSQGDGARMTNTENVKKFRLFLTHATGSTITKGLQVLGIAVPERM